MVSIDATAICAVYASHTGETGFDLIAPIANLSNIAQRLTETGKQFSAAWVGEEAQNILRIEAGIPRYGADFTEDNLLLEVGLDDAVSFSKGCYLGQEVVERIRSRGHVNKKLAGLTLEGQESASPRDVIVFADKPVGNDHQFRPFPSSGQTHRTRLCEQRLLEPGYEAHCQTQRNLGRRKRHCSAVCASPKGDGFFLLNPNLNYVY